jgi:hypothetical protein
MRQIAKINVAALMMFSLSVQAMRYDDRDRESANVEDRRDLIFNLESNELVLVCQRGYLHDADLISRTLADHERSKAIGAKAVMVTLDIVMNMLSQFPSNLSPAHPLFQAKCSVRATVIPEVTLLCQCSATEVRRACSAIFKDLESLNLGACRRR